MFIPFQHTKTTPKNLWTYKKSKSPISSDVKLSN